MKPSTIAELEARCAKLSPALAESHLRRYVAAHPDDHRGWSLLLGCLRNQLNYAEARYTVARFLGLHGETQGGLLFALEACFAHGDVDEAHRLSLRIRDPDAGRNAQSQPLRFLRLLRGDAPVPARHDESPLDATLRTFNAGATPFGASGVDVALLLKFGWHHAIQRHIAETLRARGVRCVFVRTVWEAIAARPKVLVVSDAPGGNLPALRHFLPSCRIVNTRHGLGDKNFAFRAAGQADVTCVSGPAVAREFASESMMDPERLWATGFPQMDPLFRRLARDPRPPGRRTVLVAPTFTGGLHAGEVFGTRLVQCVRGNDDSIGILIRPHPHWRRGQHELVRAWTEQAASLDGVSLNDDEASSLMDLFEEADVMVSDVSSAGLAWLATGRPLIQVVDPELARKSPYYAPDGLEWRMRAAATRVETAGALAAAVRQALDRPEPPSARYRALRAHLFGDLTDGRASERIAGRIMDWL